MSSFEEYVFCAKKKISNLTAGIHGSPHSVRHKFNIYGKPYRRRVSGRNIGHIKRKTPLRVQPQNASVRQAICAHSIAQSTRNKVSLWILFCAVVCNKRRQINRSMTVRAVIFSHHKPKYCCSAAYRPMKVDIYLFSWFIDDDDEHIKRWNLLGGLLCHYTVSLRF